MRRTVRAACVALLALLAIPPATTVAQPLALLDVPFVSQSEALCGGAAAAMVLRFWGATGLTAESFAPLLNRAATGIETTALVADVQRRGFAAVAVKGDPAFVKEQIDRGRPVIALLEDRPGTFHYVVVVAWHERGVIAHDPARAPFQVIAPDDFERRWSRSDRWALVITPNASATITSAPDHRAHDAASTEETGSCEQLVADGVRAAQSNHLDAAEESLTRAIGCPGSAPARELAGVRLLQRRWPEVQLLASEAVNADPSDTYAWKLLGTARFVSDETMAALIAWNRAGEPRVDAIRVDGLRRTRQRVIERLIDLKTGELLTATAWLRAQRQLNELPGSFRSSLAYTPVAGGLVQLRASIVERGAAPRGKAALVGVALNAAIDRQVDVSASSLTGGGERLSASYRFWPHRPRYAVELLSPTPWGGEWGVVGAYEEQSFTTDPSISRRQTAELSLSRWLAATIRAEVSGGVDRWNTDNPLGALGARAEYRSPLGRVAATVTTRGWFGERSFSMWDSAVSVASSMEHRGFVAVGHASVAGVSGAAPLELWSAGDTGQVRSTLLRAHPLLDDGRFRSDRLGRMLVSSSVEGQRWWVERPISIAATIFVDAGRTTLRRSASDLADIDVGIGARLAAPLIPGVIRVDLAKGIRDGNTALSVVIVR